MRKVRILRRRAEKELSFNYAGFVQYLGKRLGHHLGYHPQGGPKKKILKKKGGRAFVRRWGKKHNIPFNALLHYDHLFRSAPKSNRDLTKQLVTMDRYTQNYECDAHISVFYHQASSLGFEALPLSGNVLTKNAH